MATRGWENVKASDIGASQPKASKYRNVKMTIDGHRFDSKREANHWMLLKQRERLGEIAELQRQMRFPLYAPIRWKDGGVTSSGQSVQVAEYVADFAYLESGELKVVDAKGVRTQMYRLKAKWLALQDGIVIQEV